MQWWGRLLLGLTPAAWISISSATTYQFCENRMVTDAPAPWQPPRWAFGVVWPILYVCIGIAWALCPDQSAWFALLSVLLALWLPLYNCWNKCGAAALLIDGHLVLWHERGTVSPARLARFRCLANTARAVVWRTPRP